MWSLILSSAKVSKDIFISLAFNIIELEDVGNVREFKDLLRYHHNSKTLIISGSPRILDGTTLDEFFQVQPAETVRALTIENVYGLPSLSLFL